MSTSSLTQARRDESHSAPFSIPFDQAQGNSHSSMNPLPGLSHHPSAFSSTSVLPADYSIAPGICDTGYVNYFPNYQGYGTACPPAGFIPTRETVERSMNHPNFQAPGNSYSSTSSLPRMSHHTPAFSPTSVLPADYSTTPEVCDTGNVDDFPNYQGHGTACPPAGFMENAKPSMNHPNFQEPCYSLYNIPDGTATDATALMPSEYTGDQEQTSSSTFQYGFPTHPQAVLAQQQDGLEYEPQYAQEDLAVKEPQWQPAQVQSENGETQASHPIVVEPENTKVHSCGDNPRTWCSGDGVVCLDSLRTFVLEYPRAFSIGQLLELVVKAMFPEFSQHAAGQHSQIDINDTDQLQSQNGPIRRTQPSGLRVTVSTSTPATSESYLSPPDNLVVTPTSVCPVRSVTRKRQRSVEYPADPKNKGKSKNTQDEPSDDGESHANITVEDGEKRKKKRKRTGGKFICFICEILGKKYWPLSRRDALKRHLLTLHGMFQMLLNDEYSGYKILESRNINQLGDLRSLILFCLNVQAEARARGVEIKEEDDIALSEHPDVVTALHRS